MSIERLGLNRQLADHGATFDDPASQFGGFRWIGIRQSVAEYSDSSAFGVERADVGVRIDAASHPGNDGETGLGQQVAEAMGLFVSIVRTVSRADDGDGNAVSPFERSLGVEADWRIGCLPQDFGVFRIEARDDADAEFGGVFDFGLDVHFPARVQNVLHADTAQTANSTQLCLVGFKDGVRGSERFEQITERFWPDSFGHLEPKTLTAYITDGVRIRGHSTVGSKKKLRADSWVGIITAGVESAQ